MPTNVAIRPAGGVFSTNHDRIQNHIIYFSLKWFRSSLGPSGYPNIFLHFPSTWGGLGFFLLLIEYLLNFFFGQLQIDLGSSSTPRYKKLRLEGWFSVMWQLLHYITIENGSWNFSELKLLFLAAQLYTYTWMVTEWPFSFLLFSYRFQMVDCGCVQFCMNIKRLMSHSSKS